MLSLETILSVVAPHECLGCDHEGTLLCSLCRYGELEKVPDRCYMCLAATRDSAICKKCRPKSAFKHVWVATEYEGVAKKLIKLFKFERARSAYVPIAEEMSDALPYLRPDTIITYVPTATSRQRLRGYDQSELLARRIAKIKKVQYMPLFERHGQTRQVGSTKKVRHAQAEGMFRLKSCTLAADSQIIIVDDILTTGASLEATARLLKNDGFKNISGVVFAQKH